MIDSEKTIKLLRDYELLTCDNNVVWAEKAFIVNSVIRWAVGRLETNEMSIKQMENFGDILLMYLDNKVKIYWECGILKVEAIEEKTKKVENG